MRQKEQSQSCWNSAPTAGAASVCVQNLIPENLGMVGMQECALCSHAGRRAAFPWIVGVAGLGNSCESRSVWLCSQLSSAGIMDQDKA